MAQCGVAGPNLSIHVLYTSGIDIMSCISRLIYVYYNFYVINFVYFIHLLFYFQIVFLNMYTLHIYYIFRDIAHYFICYTTVLHLSNLI